jgi:hypothetical protein
MDCKKNTNHGNGLLQNLSTFSDCSTLIVAMHMSYCKKKHYGHMPHRSNSDSGQELFLERSESSGSGGNGEVCGGQQRGTRELIIEAAQNGERGVGQ